MQITEWLASVKFKGSEGTTPATETIELRGNKCARDDLPKRISESLKDAMALLGDHAKANKQIKELETGKEKAEKRVLELGMEVDELKKKIELMKEADKAPPVEDHGLILTDDEPEEEHQVQKPPKRSRK